MEWGLSKSKFFTLRSKQLQGVPRNMTVDNSFECRLPYTVSDIIKAVCSLFRLKNSLFHYNIFIISFGIKQLKGSVREKWKGGIGLMR